MTMAMQDKTAGTATPLQDLPAARQESNAQTIRALAAHQALLTLMHHGAPDSKALARLAIPMTERDFLDMCEERALVGKCGNPLCPEVHTARAPLERAHIDWRSLEMVRVTVERHWCSKACHAKCAQFAATLGTAVDRLEVLRRLKRRTGQTPGCLADPAIVTHGKALQSNATIEDVRKSILLTTVRERTPGVAVVVADQADKVGTEPLEPGAAASNGHGPGGSTPAEPSARDKGQDASSAAGRRRRRQPASVALLRDIKRSSAPPPEPGDFWSDEEEDGNGDAQSDTVRPASVAGPGEAPATAHTVLSGKEVLLSCKATSEPLLNGLDVDVGVDAVSTPSTAAPRARPSKNVKGKFKPAMSRRKPGQPAAEAASSPEVPHSDMPADQDDAVEPLQDALDRRCVSLPGNGLDAIATLRAASTARLRRRVSFGTRSVQAYDPQDIPAYIALHPVREEQPMSPVSPHHSRGCRALGVGIDPADSSGGHDDAAPAADEAGRAACGASGVPSEAVADADKDDDGVTPLLYFNLEGGAGGALDGVEGALRVTTAEELKLSSDELASLRGDLLHRVAAAEAVAASEASSLSAADDGDDDDDEYEDASDSECYDATQTLNEEGADEGATATTAAAAEFRRPRLKNAQQRPLLSQVEGLEVSEEGQRRLNEQALADAFRYYLAPEAGGVGVPVQVSSLHSVAANLAQRSNPAPLAPGAVSGAASGDAVPAQPAAHVELEGDEGDDADSGLSSELDFYEADGLLDEAKGVEEGDNECGGERSQGVEGFFNAGATAAPQLSPFAVAWRLLGLWVSQRTLLYVHGRSAAEAPPMPEHVFQAQKAFVALLMGHLPRVLAAVSLAVPVTVVQEPLSDLVHTLDLRDGLPTLPESLLEVLLLVLLVALGKRRLADTVGELDTGGAQFKERLVRVGLTVELFQCLVECLTEQ